MSNLRQFRDTKYLVSFNGEIINSKTNRTLRQYTKEKGYKFVILTHVGEKKSYHIHRLVAELFVINPNNYNQVNHKDGNKANNNADNLEWCDNSINQIHAHKTGLKPSGELLWNAKFNKRTVAMIKSLKEAGYKQAHIAEAFKTSKGTISQILNNKRYQY